MTLLILPLLLFSAYWFGYRRGVLSAKDRLFETIRASHEVCETFNRLAAASSAERDAWFAGFRREYPDGVHVKGAEDLRGNG